MAAIQQQISQLIKGTTGLMGALCLSAATHAQVYVELDVAPWSHSNYINPQADTTIIVAISNSSTADADSADFNATLIDQESIRLGFGKASPLSSWMGDPDNDTNTDSLFSFDIAAADIRCSDDWVGISGQTLAGQQFFGSDWIDTGDCTEQGCHPEREPARLQTPVVTGDSWSRNDGDWWGNTTVIAKDAYRVFAVSGEQLGRHESNVYGRGMVRKIDQHLNNSVSPDSLIVFGGINDSMQGAHAGEAKFAVADIVFKAKQRSDIRDILIIGPGPFGNRASWRTAKQTEHDELLSWLPQFAAAEGLPYLDTYSLVGDPADPRDIRLDYDSGDGAHLNEPGTRRLANAIDALFIKTRLGEPAGAPRVTAQSIEWDVSRRAYDTLVADANQLAWDRIEPDPEVIPLSRGFPATGRWYTEIKVTSVAAEPAGRIGFTRLSTQGNLWDSRPGDEGAPPAIDLASTKAVRNGVAYGFGKLNIEPGAVVGFAYDADANLAWLHVNGHWQEAGAVNALPEAGTGGLLLEDADDFVIAVATTTGTVTLEIPELIPTAHVPSGFDTLR